MTGLRPVNAVLWLGSLIAQGRGHRGGTPPRHPFFWSRVLWFVACASLVGVGVASLSLQLVLLVFRCVDPLLPLGLVDTLCVMWEWDFGCVLVVVVVLGFWLVLLVLEL